MSTKRRYYFYINLNNSINGTEKNIILDNRINYYNTISNDNPIVRIRKKIKYICHINKKKNIILL
jgi:hypothetical protein|tara:strand:- start:277 stop:471 length:195 start_codon:yes stop_codon:yes gene_type:complete